MSTHLQAAIDLLVRHAPDELYLDEDHRLHIGPECEPTAAPWQTLDRHALGSVLHPAVPWVCTSCGADDPHAAWADAVAELGHRIFSLDEIVRDPDIALPHRAQATPRWHALDATREPAPACCMRETTLADRDVWRETFETLLGQHIHAHVTALAAGHGKPTVWVALPTAELLVRHPVDGSPRRLAPLGTFHPWASVQDATGAAAIVILHLPRTLAGLALAHGGVRLNPAHVSAASWPAARAVLATALAEPHVRPADYTSVAHERAVLRRIPDILEVAHAATH